MPITPWAALVRLISDGDPVNALFTRPPADDLTQRTQYLKEVTDALRAQQLLIIPDAAVQSGVVVGTPVYLDLGTNTYRPAIAAATDVAAALTALPTAFVAGIVVDLSAPTRGTIGSYGRFVDLPNLAAWNGLMETGTGPAVVGNYYLSSLQAGRLSRNPGSLGVYIGQLSSTGVFYVKATPPDYGAHTHHAFELSPLPAVANLATDITENIITGAWTITAPNAAYRGWLPANAQPSNTWPTGWTSTEANKAFWYNLNHVDDAGLRALFPPIPPDSHVFVQGGLVQPASRVIVNEYGIWWTENINGAETRAPWSETVQSTPADEPIIDFWFSRILLATDGGVVSSLVFSPNTKLTGRFVRAGGVAATDGALQLILDALVQDAPLDEGDLAVKSITGPKFTRGPAVRGIKVSGGVTATSTAVDPDTGGMYGLITLNVVDSSISQGIAAIADLNNAKVDSLEGLQAVSLLPGRTASPVFTIDVSPAAPATASMALAFWLYSSGSGVLPTTNALQVNYKIVPPSTSPAVPVAIPGSWTALAQITAATTGMTALVAGSYAKTDPTAVAYPFVIPAVPRGSVVLVQIVRQGSLDGFSGTLSIPRLEYALVQP